MPINFKTMVKNFHEGALHGFLKKALVEVTRLLDENSSARLGGSPKLHKSKRLLTAGAIGCMLN